MAEVDSLGQGRKDNDIEWVMRFSQTMVNFFIVFQDLADIRVKYNCENQPLFL